MRLPPHAAAGPVGTLGRYQLPSQLGHYMHGAIDIDQGRVTALATRVHTMSRGLAAA